MGDDMQRSALESVEKLCSIIDEGRWNDEYSKRYAQVLCENISLRLQAASSFIPRATNNSSQLRKAEGVVPIKTQPLKTVIEMKKTEDFIEWRKYGSEIINKKKYRRRDYWECDHEGCPAKKLVEEIDDIGINVRVCYIENHNCKKHYKNPTPVDGSAGYSTMAAPISKQDQQDNEESSTGGKHIGGWTETVILQHKGELIALLAQINSKTKSLQQP